MKLTKISLLIAMCGAIALLILSNNNSPITMVSEDTAKEQHPVQRPDKNESRDAPLKREVVLVDTKASAEPFVQIESIARSGLTSPEGALQQETWAMKNGDFKEAARAIKFSPKAKPVVDEMYKRLPDYIRNTFSSSEEMWMALMSANPKRQNPIARQEVYKEALPSGGVTLTGRIKYENGTTLDSVGHYQFSSDSGEWRRVISDNYLVSFYAQPAYTANMLAAVRNLPPVPAEVPHREIGAPKIKPNTLDDIIASGDKKE